jgi:hypothetical protein
MILTTAVSVKCEERYADCSGQKFGEYTAKDLTLVRTSLARCLETMVRLVTGQKFLKSATRPNLNESGNRPHVTFRLSARASQEVALL